MFEPCEIIDGRTCGYSATHNGLKWCGIARGGEDANGNPNNCVSYWSVGTKCPKKTYRKKYVPRYRRVWKDTDKINNAVKKQRLNHNDKRS